MSTSVALVIGRYAIHNVGDHTDTVGAIDDAVQGVVVDCFDLKTDDALCTMVVLVRAWRGRVLRHVVPLNDVTVGEPDPRTVWEVIRRTCAEVGAGRGRPTQNDQDHIDQVHRLMHQGSSDG